MSGFVVPVPFTGLGISKVDTNVCKTPLTVSVIHTSIVWFLTTRFCVHVMIHTVRYRAKEKVVVIEATV